MLLDGEDAYRKAKEMLSKRFGDSFAVAAAFRRKLDTWPQISPNDVQGLRNYADFLVQCEKAMEKISSLKVLDDDQENHKLASKLPRWTLVRWGRRVYDWKEKNHNFPPFSEFVKYLVTESNIACDPVISRFKEDDSKKAKSRPYEIPNRRNRPNRDEYRSRNTLATRSEEGDQSKERPNGEAKQTTCILCNGPHELNSCQSFCAKDIIDRKEYAKEKGLCFGCLTQGHISKHCKRRKTCTTCKKSHPTSLHGDLRKPENNQNSQSPENPPTTNCTKTCFMNDGNEHQISSMIVPVWISHEHNPELEKLTYALLDDQSDTTFVSQEN
ncbi:Hypothetical predicted protein [Paramuricea clavata]|uniref:Uncharacterized protein n=1 Tax=Paramuricea clavata TaxID=317549 RepID=A0A6S7I4B8_PARCT|nr:Hypothetical predicted protein [Paramuricea clavata]